MWVNPYATNHRRAGVPSHKYVAIHPPGYVPETARTGRPVHPVSRVGPTLRWSQALVPEPVEGAALSLSKGCEPGDSTAEFRKSVSGTEHRLAITVHFHSVSFQEV